MEAVVQAGRSGLLEVQWPVGTPGGCGLRFSDRDCSLVYSEGYLCLHLFFLDVPPSLLFSLPPSLFPPSLSHTERSRMDSLRSEFSVVERRWVKLKADSDEWGKILDSLNPEMETFQVAIMYMYIHDKQGKDIHPGQLSL